MEDRFKFGENWKSFLQNVDESHKKNAESEIQDVYDIQSMNGSSFLDIGCGSGIFSLAAQRLGAEKVVSFDYDEDAVECCKQLRIKENADNWSIKHGDILTEHFVESLGDFDYVYCWGVVHHTGDLWKAIDSALKTVSNQGQLCLGIYNKVETGIYNSHTALRIKKMFNKSPAILKKIMIYSFAGSHLGIRTLAKKESPVEYINTYSDDNRGMDYWHDVKDWLGGLPFEFASPEEVEEYFNSNYPSFVHEKTDIRGNRPGSVNVYVFKNA